MPLDIADYAQPEVQAKLTTVIKCSQDASILAEYRNSASLIVCRQPLPSEVENETAHLLQTDYNRARLLDGLLCDITLKENNVTIKYIEGGDKMRGLEINKLPAELHALFPGREKIASYIKRKALAFLPQVFPDESDFHMRIRTSIGQTDFLHIDPWDVLAFNMSECCTQYGPLEFAQFCRPESLGGESRFLMDDESQIAESKPGDIALIRDIPHRTYFRDGPRLNHKICRLWVGIFSRKYKVPQLST